VKRGVSAFVGDRQKACQQLHAFSRALRRPANENPELAQLAIGVIALGKAGNERQLPDDGRERRALQMGRAIAPETKAIVADDA